MKFKKIIILLPLLVAMVAAASGDSPAIIPLPQKMEPVAGMFHLKPESRIVVDAAFRDSGEYLAARLRTPTGYPLKVEMSGKSQPGTGDIVLSARKTTGSPSAEGYELIVNQDTALI